MKRLFGLSVLALIVSAIPAQAAFFKSVGNGNMPVGPWYLYWPLEAHFQTPASPQYPYWAAPMTLPLPQGAAQGRGGYNPYVGSNQMQGQAPAMGGYYPYGTMPPQGGYNPYGGMGGYGGMSPYQVAPTLPAGGGSNDSVPTIRIGY